MSPYRTSLTASLALLLIGSPSLAHAQGIASSFEELRLLVRPGDTVVIHDSSGGDTRGRIGALSVSTLVLKGRSDTREFHETDVRTISARHADPLSNGALWGLGIGAAIGGLTIGTLCDGDSDCGGASALVALVYGGLGAGVGVGVDALITRQRVIYERSVGSARLGIGALLSRQRPAGAAVSVGF